MKTSYFAQATKQTSITINNQKSQQTEKLWTVFNFTDTSFVDLCINVLFL